MEYRVRRSIVDGTTHYRRGDVIDSLDARLAARLLARGVLGVGPENGLAVPRLWEGETVAIIAGGPSLTAAQVAACRGRCRLLGVNDAYRLAPDLDALYACDGKWWEAHHGVPSFAGPKFTQDKAAAARWRLTWVESRKADGLSADPRQIHSGRNSGYQAINLAVHLGAARILLLGFDMRRAADGRRHWFGRHPGGLEKDSPYQDWIKAFRTLPPDLAAAGVTVINCTPGSALDAFPAMRLEDALARVARIAGPSPARPTAYAVGGERTSPRWCRAFAAGCGGEMAADGALRPGAAALFGSPVLWPLFARVRAEGRDYFYGDHGYFGRGRYYRVTRNALQHDGSGQANAVRLDALGVAIEPWRKGGRHVLVCPPDEAFARLMGFSAAGWLAETQAALARHSDRPVVVRERARARGPRPLEADLADCWALVTYTSNAAVEAVLAGVPVFCEAACAAARMGLDDLARIEKPRRPRGRRQWACNLAANQWTLDEIASGRCWKEIGGC